MAEQGGRRVAPQLFGKGFAYPLLSSEGFGLASKPATIHDALPLRHNLSTSRCG